MATTYWLAFDVWSPVGTWGAPGTAGSAAAAVLSTVPAVVIEGKLAGRWSQFGAKGVVRLTTTSPRLRTRSGLGVGTTVVKLQHLRGLFCNLVPGGGNCETRGIRFDFARNRVTRVVVPG